MGQQQITAQAIDLQTISHLVITTRILFLIQGDLGEHVNALWLYKAAVSRFQAGNGVADKEYVGKDR